MSAGHWIERALAAWASKQEGYALARQYATLTAICRPMVDTYDRTAIVVAIASEIQVTEPRRRLATWFVSDSTTGALIGRSGTGKTIAAIRLVAHLVAQFLQPHSNGTQPPSWRTCVGLDRHEIDTLIRHPGLLVLDEAAGPGTDHVYVRGLAGRLVTHRHDAGRRTLLIGNVKPDELATWIDAGLGAGRLETRLGPGGVIDCHRSPVIRNAMVITPGPRTRAALAYIDAAYALGMCETARARGWTPRAKSLVEALGITREDKAEIEAMAEEMHLADQQVAEALAGLTASLTWRDDPT